jgi:hypothetical protein
MVSNRGLMLQGMKTYVASFCRTDSLFSHCLSCSKGGPLISCCMETKFPSLNVFCVYIKGLYFLKNLTYMLLYCLRLFYIFITGVLYIPGAKHDCTLKIHNSALYLDVCGDFNDPN